MIVHNPYPVVYKVEVWSVGKPYVCCSPESCFAAAQCSCARWKVKVASNLTGVWQQLFEQQGIMVIVLCHFHPWLHENHTSALAWRQTETETQEHVYQTPVMDIDELKQHLIETRSATSTASLVKRFISGEIVFKPKTNILNICYDMFLRHFIFMTSKAFVTASRYKQIDLACFVSQGKGPSGDLGNCVAVLLQICSSICVPKVIKIQYGKMKLFQK